MKIGFLINPVAGMGGRVGLKGTDDLAEAAARLGAQPVALGRALATLKALAALFAAERPVEPVEWLTCSGPMGEDALRGAGFGEIAVAHRAASPSSAADTTEAIRRFLAAGVGLILFCGGDGTARDVAAVAGQAVPILGIPSGVKMYSGVFGITPERTAQLVAGFIAGRLQPVETDLLDLDEEHYRQGQWVVRAVGAALTPFEPTLTQTAKALIVEASDEEAKADIADDLRERIDARPGTLFILCPGSTVRAVADRLGVEKTLLGVDALLDGRLAGRDLSEREILDLLDGAPSAMLILSPLGAQGVVLGRGNLQLSPRVIRRIGVENILVVATPAKLQRTPVLHFDTGDPALDRELVGNGYLAVVVGRHTMRMVAVS